MISRYLLWMVVLQYVLLAWCFPLPLTAQENAREQAMQYAIANEYLFWKQVSLHYPLSRDQIKRYAEQLSFYVLSSNEHLQWTPGLLSEFADNWTSDVFRNPAVPWDQSLFEQFKDAPWFEWDYITQHGDLLVSKEFFTKYERDIRHVQVSDSLYGDSVRLYGDWGVYYPPVLFEGFLLDRAYDRQPKPASLSLHLKDSIQHVPVDTLIKYANWIDKFKFSYCQKCNWSLPEFEKIFPFLHHGDLFINKAIYHTQFDGIIDDAFIEEVHQKQYPPDEIRFYFFKRGPDSLGIVPTIQFIRNPYLTFEDKMGSTDKFPDTLVSSHYILGGNWNPPMRFADYLAFEQRGYQTDLTALFVSSRFKTILENGALPPHRFYPISISIDDPLYGQASMSYHVLLLDNSSIDQIDDEKLQLVNSLTLYKNPITIRDTVYSTFFERLNYRYFMDSLRSQPEYSDIKVPNVYMDTYYDLFAMRPGVIMASPRLKRAMEEAGITGVQMSVINTSHPVVHMMKEKAPDTPIPLSKKMRGRNPLRDQLTVRNFAIATARRDAILSALPVVADMYSKKPVSEYTAFDTNLIHRDTLLRSLEIKWDVQFPTKYRDALIRKKLPNLGPEYRGYFLFDIDRLLPLGEAWHAQYPVMVKGVMIGTDGAGINLHLLLEKDSTYKLGSMVYITGNDSSYPVPLFDMDERIK